MPSIVCVFASVSALVYRPPIQADAVKLMQSNWCSQTDTVNTVFGSPSLTLLEQFSQIALPFALLMARGTQCDRECISRASKTNWLSWENYPTRNLTRMQHASMHSTGSLMLTPKQLNSGRTAVQKATEDHFLLLSTYFSLSSTRRSHLFRLCCLDCTGNRRTTLAECPLAVRPPLFISLSLSSLVYCLILFAFCLLFTFFELSRKKDFTLSS